MKFMSIKYILGVGKLLAGAAVDVLPGSKMIRKPLKSCNSLSMMTTNIGENIVFVWLIPTYYICYFTNKTKWNTNCCNGENSDSKCNKNTVRRGNQLPINIVFQIK